MNFKGKLFIYISSYIVHKGVLLSGENGVY